MWTSIPGRSIFLIRPTMKNPAAKECASIPAEERHQLLHLLLLLPLAPCWHFLLAELLWIGSSSRVDFFHPYEQQYGPVQLPLNTAWFLLHLHKGWLPISEKSFQCLIDSLYNRLWSIIATHGINPLFFHFDSLFFKISPQSSRINKFFGFRWIPTYSS